MGSPRSPTSLGTSDATTITLLGAGLPVALLRGVALLARAAGLLGQLAEELEHPIAREVYLEVHDHTAYVPPPD